MIKKSLLWIVVTLSSKLFVSCGEDTHAGIESNLQLETFNTETKFYRRFSLQSTWGKWFCAEGGGGQSVVVNRETPLIWESFIMEQDSPVLKSGSALNIQSFNGHYLVADPLFKRLLANRTIASTYERFVIVKVGANDGDPISSGDIVSLQTFQGAWLSPQPSGQQVQIDRQAIGPWEKLRIKFGPAMGI